MVMIGLGVQLSGYSVWVACMEQETHMHQTDICLIVTSQLRRRMEDALPCWPVKRLDLASKLCDSGS